MTSKTTTVKTITQAKAQAKILKKNMKLQTVGASLNELAKMNGYKNWHAFRAVLQDDEAVRGETMYSLNVNEQAFRAAGIIMDIPLDDVNTFIKWFNLNLSFTDVLFFERKRDIVDLLDNNLKNPMAILYPYIAFSGLQNMDSVLRINKIKNLTFEEFMGKYVKDLDSVDFGVINLEGKHDFFIALNDDAYRDFPKQTRSFGAF